MYVLPYIFWRRLSSAAEIAPNISFQWTRKRIWRGSMNTFVKRS